MVTLMRLLCVVSGLCIITGCGEWKNEMTTSWKNPFFIDSSNIGMLRIDRLDSVFGINPPQTYHHSWSMWSCSKAGIDFKMKMDKEEDLMNWYGFVFEAYPFVWLGTEQLGVYNVVTLERKDMPKIEQGSIAFSWNWKYYFTYNYERNIADTSFKDSNFVYDAETNKIVAAFYGKRPINFDKSCTRVLLSNITKLEYYNLADSTFSEIKAYPYVIVSDYRYGKVALAVMDDSTYSYSMIPAFDTLSEKISHVNWYENAYRGTMFNLENGDFVSNTAYHIVFGNICENYEKELAHNEFTIIE